MLIPSLSTLLSASIACSYLNTLVQFLFHDRAFRRAIYMYDPAAAMQFANGGLLPAESDALVPAASSASNASSAVVAVGAHSKPSFIRHLQQVFAHLEHSRMSSYNPLHFVNALGLGLSDQQDVHEFLNLLVFNTLASELSLSPHSVCRAVMPRLFTGRMVNVMEGQICMHTSERSTEFHDIGTIQIKGKKTLEECLDGFFKKGERV
jgi:hypothetical protein